MIKTEAKYNIIQNAVAERIGNGTYTIDSTIPTEVALAEEFKAHRHTVRKALAILTEQGLIERTPGRGTIVKSRTAALVQKKTKLIYRIPAADNPASERYKAAENIKKLFCAENPDIDIKIEAVQTDHATTPEAIAGIHGHSSPVVMHVNFTADLAAAGYLIPLSDFSDLSETVSPLEGRLMKKFAGEDGHERLYSLPLQYGSRMMMVNLNLFEEAGFIETDLPKNWHDFIALCNLIKKRKPDITPLDFDMAYGTQTFTRFLPYLFSADGGENKIINKDGSINLSGKGCTAFVEFIHKLLTEKLCSTEQDKQNFYQGKAVFLVSGIMNSAKTARHNIENCRVKSIPFPDYNSASGQTTVIHGEYGCILKNTIKTNEEKNAAWKLLKFLASKEIQKMICETLQQLPARTDLYQSIKKCDPEISAFYDYGIRYGIPYIDIPGNDLFNNIALKTFLMAIDSKKDYKKILKDGEDLLNNYLSNSLLQKKSVHHVERGE
ncbi:MAG: ABC transporter substrate-binding protein [Planctomycetota bacterium]|jgi:ABC-type glycerol-3-phosphate transport system substrate-binding protein